MFLAFGLSSAPVMGSSQPYICGHNINFGTGNKYLSETDISLGSLGKTLTFKRIYNSQNNENGLLGYGWSPPFSSHLKIEVGKIILVYSSGRHVYYLDNGQGGWTNRTGRISTIKATPDGYQLTNSNKTIYSFDKAGKLTRIQTRNKLEQIFTYSNNLLISVTDTFGRTLVLAYDQNGRLETLTTPVGTFTYTYDANDNLLSLKKPDNTIKQYIYDDPYDIHNLTGIINEENIKSLTVTYDIEDRVTSSSFEDGKGAVQIEYLPDFQRIITNSQGVKSTYRLESKSRVIRVKSCSGPGCSVCGEDTGMEYTYNDRLQVIQSKDGNGNITTYEYDKKGNRTKKTEAKGTAWERTTNWTYDPATDLISSVTTASAVIPDQQKTISMTYDTNGNLLSQTESGFSGPNAIGRTITYTYDTYGRITSIDGARKDVSDITTFSYYANKAKQKDRGNLDSITDALGHSTTFSQYNAFGKPGLIATTAGSIKMTYDMMGRLLKKTSEKEGLIVNYTHTASGKLERIRDNLGNSITYKYDTQNRRAREEIRDPDNELKRFIDFEYADSGKLDKIILSDGSSVDLNYDMAGNLVGKTDELGKSTSYRYDVLNRLKTAIEPDNKATEYKYDIQDNLTSFIDTKGDTTTFTYDDFGRRLSRNSLDTGLTTYSYDADSNLTSITDANNNTTTYEYDILNRLTAIHYKDSLQDTIYRYDEGANGIGRLTSIQDATGSIIYSYDSLGRLVQEKDIKNDQTFITSYKYDNNSELITITNPSGKVIAYSNNSADPMASVTPIYNGITTIISGNINHLPFDQITTMPLGKDQFSFNSFDKPSGKNFAFGNMDWLVVALDKYIDLGYGYDDAVNRLSFEGSGITAYNYEKYSIHLAQAIEQKAINHDYDQSRNIILDSDLDGNIMNEYVYINGELVTLFHHPLKPEFNIEVMTSTGGPLAETTVYAFDENDIYTGIKSSTDENGLAHFQRSDFGERTYRFRVDYLGDNFWSEFENIRNKNQISIIIETEPVEIANLPIR